MDESTYKPVSVGNWLVTYLLMCIPIVNLIMLFVWGFGGGTPVSKANWAKASLIWMVIFFVFYFLLFVLLGVGAMLVSQSS